MTRNKKDPEVENVTPGAKGSFMGQIFSYDEAPMRLSEMNRSLEESGQRFWEIRSEGRKVATHFLEEFSAIAAALETRGWSAERIQEQLKPSRDVFATSSFMRRCQEWPRGYAGDFETIEYLAAGRNHSVPGSLGWHFEDILLKSAIVQQHLNKLRLQSLEIVRAVTRNRSARVFSMACGGCLDWVPVVPYLKDFAGDIVLNDHEPAALELAERRLRLATTQYRLAPGNVLRVAKRLVSGTRFDLIVAGGLFDYLPDRAVVFLLRVISHDLLASGGVLLFTNIAEGNPARALMEHGANWTLIERSEEQIRELCREAGIARSSLSLERDPTRLTLIARVVRVVSRTGRRLPVGLHNGLERSAQALTAGQTATRPEVFALAPDSVHTGSLLHHPLRCAT